MALNASVSLKCFVESVGDFEGVGAGRWHNIGDFLED